MKVAVTGKGGVGKTTFSSALAKLAALRGLKVLAVDADPDANLAMGLGLSTRQAESIVPLSQMKELVEERTGVKRGGFGAFFKLNPKVDDIPDRFCTPIDGIKLLVMGKVEKGGEGCVCPESVLLKTMLKHLLVERDEVVILDMEAGLEHLGRGTAQSMDALVVVVEADQRSIETSKIIKKLAKDLRLDRIFVVLNKISDPEEEEAVKTALTGFDILGVLPYSKVIRQKSLEGNIDYKSDKEFWGEVIEINKRLRKEIERGKSS